METRIYLIIDFNRDSLVHKQEISTENNLILMKEMKMKTHGWTKPLKRKEINKGLN